jgi:hypothetical protein
MVRLSIGLDTKNAKNRKGTEVGQASWLNSCSPPPLWARYASQVNGIRYRIFALDHFPLKPTKRGKAGTARWVVRERRLSAAHIQPDGPVVRPYPKRQRLLCV